MKAKGSFILLITALLILGVGYATINITSNAIDGTNDKINATVSNTNTVYSIVPSILIVIAIMAVIPIVIWYVSSTERYQKGHRTIIRILKFLDTTTYYFAFGLISYAIFGSIAGLVYLLYNVALYAGETGVGIDIAKWISIGILFFFGTALIGYLFKKYIWNKWMKRRKEMEYKRNMEELPEG